MIFLDTGFLFALFVVGDEDHGRVQEVFEGFRGQRLQDLLLTTNHVVAETVTLLRKRGHPDSRVRHGLAVSVGEQILAGILGRVHRASADEEGAALAYLAKHQARTDLLGKALILVLCVFEFLALASTWIWAMKGRTLGLASP